MASLDHLEKFIRDTAGASTFDGVFAVLLSFINLLGFDYATIEVSGLSNVTHAFYRTNYPKEWIERYVEKRYTRHDMICRHAAQTMSPFPWTDVTNNLQLTIDQKNIRGEGTEHGLRSGGTIPLHGPSGQRGQLSVASGTMPPEEAAKHFKLHAHELLLIATHVFEKIISFNIDSAQKSISPLTPRDVEILTWTAVGKSCWDIATMLGLAESSVKNRIFAICKKLNASSKTHATAVALTHGYISL